MNKLKHYLWLLALLLVACTEDAEEMTGNLTGRITDAISGEAIQGANVTLSPEGLTKITGSDGIYEFIEIESRQYTVQAQKAGYESNTKTVNVLVDKVATADISLTPIGNLELNTTTLNFGKTNSSLSFEIRNKGTSKFNWNISGLSTASWLDVNPGSGALEGGKSCTVQVNVLRNKLNKNAELTLTVNADKESVPLKITVEVEKVSTKIEVSPSKLDFGTDESVLTFSVKNIGNAGNLDWNVTELDVDWITISPMKGTLGEDKAQAVKVTLARELVKGHLKTAILINAGGESLPIEITADEKGTQYIAVTPVQVEFGKDKEKIPLTLTSHNASVAYTLLKKEGDATWLSLSKTNGNIPQYDAANPAMKETVELSVDRKGLKEGTYSCTLVVKTNKEELEVPVTMQVEEKAQRDFRVQPSVLSVGLEKSISFTMFSGNGATPYRLKTKEEISWLTFSKVEGTVADGGSETISVTINRDGLTPGNYSCTVIVRTDLGDTEIPLTMIVEETGEAIAVPQGLYVYYKFEDDFNDATENAVNGFGMNSPTFVEGVTPASKAVKFNRSNNSSFNVNKPIIDSRDMTISFWGKDFNDGNIFYMVSSIQNNPMFTLSMSDGRLKFIVTRYNNGYQYTGTGSFSHPTLTDGKWHHVVIVSDFNKTSYSTITTTLYIDGLSVDTVTENANVFTEAGSDGTYGTGIKFIMGGSLRLNNSTTLNATNMSVDNFRVYDTRRLSAEEVKTLYNKKQ